MNSQKNVAEKRRTILCGGESVYLVFLIFPSPSHMLLFSHYDLGCFPYTTLSPDTCKQGKRKIRWEREFEPYSEQNKKSLFFVGISSSSSVLHKAQRSDLHADDHCKTKIVF